MKTATVIKLCLALFLLAPVAPADGPDEKAQKRSWARRGGSSKQFEELRQILQSAIAAPDVPGLSLQVIVKGDVVFDEGFGLFNPVTERPFSPDEHCWIASITKTVSATLFAVLVDEGLVRFEDPVGKYIEEYASLKMIGSGEPVRSPTIAECLSHTGGFDANDARGIWRFPSIYSGDLAGVSREIAERGLRFEPGTQHAYSRLGFDVTARVAEIVTDKPYTEALDHYLLEPLGMKDTTYHPDETIRDEIPAGAADEEMPAGKAGSVNPFTMSRGGYVNAGGGLVSTADDLARFFLFHSALGRVGKKKVVDKKTLQLLYVLQPATNGFGIGFGVENPDRKGVARVIRHGGATGTMAWLDREKEVIFIGLSQAGTEAIKSTWTAAAGVVRAAFVPGYKKQVQARTTSGGKSGRDRSAFRRLDRNGDGKLSKKELPAQARGRFSAADTNGDGFLSEEEFDAAMKKKPPRD